MNLSTEVILCTYNGARFISEQLESIVRQTRPVDKISIRDDRSSDDTVGRIHEFIARQGPDDQRRFDLQVNESNLGYARNFCNAIAESTQDLLFLCDQDDIWDPLKVETLAELFKQHQTDMIFSDGILIDQYGQELGGKTVLQSYGLTNASLASFGNKAFELLIRRNYINGAAIAIRRSRAQEALPLPCDMPHDYWLAIWCSLHRGLFGTPQTLYRYRQHAHNAIGMGPSGFLYEFLGLWRHPSAPRERELRIWASVTNRIAGLPREREIAAAERKLAWLSRIVTEDKRSLARAYEIVKSIFNRSYANYSPGNACLRDIMSFIR